jgi:hypothetical protein
MLIKLEAAPRYAALAVGGTLWGWRILRTGPAAAEYTVEVPDDQADLLPRLQRQGALVTWQATGE